MEGNLLNEMDSLIENISSKIALNLCQSKDKSSEEFAVLKYGVFVFVHISIAAIFTIIFGILTKTLFQIVTIFLLGGLMKRYSGGVHCSSPNRCVITGIIISYTFALIGKNIVNIDLKIGYMLGMVALIHSFIILYKKCPVPSENKPLKKEETRKKLRKNAFLIYYICVVLFILNILLNLQSAYTILNSLVVCIILGLYMQTLSLTSIGIKFILFLDKVLLKFRI